MRASLAIVLALTAWLTWMRRAMLPARPTWRLEVGVYAFVAADLLYLACRGYIQVLGL